MKTFEKILATAVAIFVTVGSLAFIIGVYITELSAPNLHIMDYIIIIFKPILIGIFAVLLLQVYSWSLSKINEMLEERYK